MKTLIALIMVTLSSSTTLVIDSADVHYAPVFNSQGLQIGTLSVPNEDGVPKTELCIDTDHNFMCISENGELSIFKSKTLKWSDV